MPLRRFLCLLLPALSCAALVVGCGGGDEDGPSIPFPDTTPVSAEEAARLEEILKRVVEIRGLDPNPDVKPGLISREALRQYSEEAYDDIEDEAQHELDAITLAYRMLRMIGPQDKIEDIAQESFGGDVVGLYLPDEKRLVLVGDTITGDMSEEGTIAHEFAHSLQDEAFDLLKFQKRAEKEKGREFAEYSTTLSCVYEGDAVLTEVLYLTEVHGPEWLFGALEGGDAAEAASEGTAIPDAMQRYFYFDYTECFAFVAQIWEEDGWEGVDRLYENPPDTTEQVLHVDRYRRDEQPRRIPPSDLAKVLGEPWTALEGQRFGEFDVYNYLFTAGLESGEAARAAEGWGGGQMGIYVRGGEAEETQEVVLHISLGWDSLNEYSQFLAAFDTAIDRFAYETRNKDALVWDWSGTREYGFAVWNEKNFSVELLFGTDQAEVSGVAASLAETVTASR